MNILTELALSRRAVAVLMVILALVGGVLTYRSLQVELFPDVEFPLVSVFTSYPSANPEAVVQDVTEPIEDAIAGVKGVESIESTSSENLSVVLVSFKLGTDMDEAEQSIVTNVSRIGFPTGVQDPSVLRIDPERFPVLQLMILSDQDIPRLARTIRSDILPTINRVEGVARVDLIGEIKEQLVITVDPTEMSNLGLSLGQISNALAANNISFPAGSISEQGKSFPIRTTNEYSSLDQIRNLVVGFEAPDAGSALQPNLGFSSSGNPILLSRVADLRLSSEESGSQSLTNGKPSMGIAVIKDPDANTVEVTENVLHALDTLSSLPPDVEIITFLNDGPEIQKQIDTLLHEGFYGLLFAISVVFMFLFSTKPTVVKGIFSTARPTMVIGIAIPLSILTGVLLMGAFGMTLNFMTLGGLAIAVGRVVDDSIVVLENLYRHMEKDGGKDRVKTALTSTKEVTPAIITSTLTTVAVFAPLGFIEGLVGSFFFPFALTVSFALAASTMVALTAVPVIGSILLRPGDVIQSQNSADSLSYKEPLTKRIYIPILSWALKHKIATLIPSFGVALASLGLLAFIPVTLFPSGGIQFLEMQLELPLGASMERTKTSVQPVEDHLAFLKNQGAIDLYQTTIGNNPNAVNFNQVIGGGHTANSLVRLTENAPDNLSAELREKFPTTPEFSFSVSDVDTAGPPQSGLEMSITANNYNNLVIATDSIMERLGDIEGLVNVTSDISEARDEFIIEVNPLKAAEIGLSVRDVASQVNLFLVGSTVTTIKAGSSDKMTIQRGISESTEDIDVVLKARPSEVDSLSEVKSLTISGPLGFAPLGEISKILPSKGPVTISRTDAKRSASVTGAITGRDTQRIGAIVETKIDSIDLPSGVDVSIGGVFQDITEGFNAIFLSMGIGIVIVYLVMVAGLGSLRDPFVIVTSLPLAIIGALASLAITGRSLGLPAMMGMLLLIGVVVTNAVVFVYFVVQLRSQGYGVQEALIEAGRVRLRPILMTAVTTAFALIPLASFASSDSGLISAELATVVIGGLVTSTFLTLVVVPVVYTIMHENLPQFLKRSWEKFTPKRT